MQRKQRNKMFKSIKFARTWGILEIALGLCEQIIWYKVATNEAVGEDRDLLDPLSKEHGFHPLGLQLCSRATTCHIWLCKFKFELIKMKTLVPPSILGTFHMLSSPHVMAIILGTADREHFHQHRKFFWAMLVQAI